MVVSFIMSHTLTVAPEDKDNVLSRMDSYKSHEQERMSPRLVNRQLKYAFSRMQQSLLHNHIIRLYRILERSDGSSGWLATFLAITGIGMVLEDCQITAHVAQMTNAREGNFDPRATQELAIAANTDIDAAFQMLQQIYDRKFNPRYNPMFSSNYGRRKEAGLQDSASVLFVGDLLQLLKSHSMCSTYQSMCKR